MNSRRRQASSIRKSEQSPMNKRRIKEYEDNLVTINREIEKRRGRWMLSSLTWMDFEDVSQIIRIHIFQKWGQFDKSQPIEPWLNTVITNQIKNIVRNNYSSYVRPCLKCAASLPDEGCSVYKIQCSKCPLYAKWHEKKRSAYDVKVPLPIENHGHEIQKIQSESHSNPEINPELHLKIRTILKESEWVVYESIFINNESEDRVAKKMGFKTREKNRSPGYKQIKNITKSIIKKVKRAIESGDIDVY